MDKLVQCVEWNFPNLIPNKIYCYGEASLEANQAMQEPLEKLYKYENQPDIREKVKEYMSDLDTEIDRCHQLAEQNMEDDSTTLTEIMLVRIQTLTEVKNDLQGRLDELI